MCTWSGVLRTPSLFQANPRTLHSSLFSKYRQIHLWWPGCNIPLLEQYTVWPDCGIPLLEQYAAASLAVKELQPLRQDTRYCPPCNCFVFIMVEWMCYCSLLLSRVSYQVFVQTQKDHLIVSIATWNWWLGPELEHLPPPPTGNISCISSIQAV